MAVWQLSADFLAVTLHTYASHMHFRQAFIVTKQAVSLVTHSQLTMILHAV